MTTDIQEFYQKTILPLSEKDQLKLASLILKRVTEKKETPQKKGDITKYFGVYKGGDPNGSDNEQIDADLAHAYSDNHEENGYAD